MFEKTHHQLIFLVALIIFLNFLLKKSFICYYKYQILILSKFQIQLYKDRSKNICWIFNNKFSYRVLISFCSIIKTNPGQNFHYYFILPPNETLNTKIFYHFLPTGSKLYIRHYKPKHTYIPTYANMTCRWPNIIIVKLFLCDILPEVKKILYLDTDTVNAAPLDFLWLMDMTNKTIGVTERIQFGGGWVNSGVIFYNLENLRKQPTKLWECANQKECYIDDNWHTHCHTKEMKYIIPYRYNVEFASMYKLRRKPFQLYEERNAVFYHLKDKSQEIYKIKRRSDIKNMKVIQNVTDVYDALQKIYSIKNWVDSEIKKIDV